jgi:hypothetical protein
MLHLLAGAVQLLTSLQRRLHSVVTLPSQSSLFTASRKVIAGVARPAWPLAHSSAGMRSGPVYPFQKVQQRKVQRKVQRTQRV